MTLTKFHGIIPAFYACYDDQGNISESRTHALCDYLFEKGVQGVYVGGSSGECIYQSLDERKAVLSYVASNLKGKMTLIAHVGAPSTRDSIELAKHAATLGYDALSAIPPIYFKLPDSAVYKYWSEIMEATPLSFIIYNIPQTTGYTLTPSLFEKLLANKKVIGVKNSSMPTMDIERFKRVGGKDVVVFNGPDEQYVAGRIMGADAGIGGTYAVMPELFLQANEFVKAGKFEEAGQIQSDINDIIIALCSLKGAMYAGIKEILKLRGVNIGSVRAPLEAVAAEDAGPIADIMKLIDQAIERYCG
ncbi:MULTISPECIES: dihydrodipicolinate synthase family protein [Paenibacillus]|jgi:N-acetylneuraminate lyase|uniref:N-acetylneuraminate lyase n=1 Tax=Paenibacillus odorifer TaxID=189426 RepID=A0ABX3GSE9_9BACL|nr:MULTISPECIES: dihydrodipicolinate synthase family protein [Paenibacillus]AIQ76282.1 N-acetylneuraminate lyase [Paenibacillus odorifer]MDH6430833.1 N-acetylneuraminate lyase [Paenibacillus sp. PastH-4]MDH6446731.1 N-acetylneuraminate lyase [Paenibacillus sp. PastF-4]MDH6531185.1 N-acetylneuraminate lyase [Paenibacillus sp. PastH-3]MEC0134972.1 dihydrodipicolinate synthase family protein [Paenibacillus odorifer]